MKQLEVDDFMVEKSNLDMEQTACYEALISCLADIIIKSNENKDIDKHFI